ncbi:MAG: 23S rRNA (uracil(1939)-C(5))-methyltransferase RlmD [Deltaproteobacteria bacterium]|nr:23S rRNA (uracil(1939)-C(5))-methyltransferase RlmD [Deltaproteobacteria bacterium]
MTHQLSPITIEKLVIGGHGLSRLADGKIVLVPFVLPGEEVVVRPVSRKKSFMQASVVDILKPSPDRTKPPCTYYPRCGGCDFQHVRADRQADLKNRILLEQLERSTLQADCGKLLSPPLSSPQPFHYRQRIRLHVGKNGELGFHRGQSHEVEPITSCLLARPPLNEILAYLAGHPSFYKIAPLTTSVELLLSPVDEAVVVLLNLTRKLRPAERGVVEELASGDSRIKSVVVLATGSGVPELFSRGEPKGEQPLLHFSHLLPDGDRLGMTIEPGGFCQVNSAQNENLTSLLLDWARVDGGSRVLDLFCGMGNFSLPLARGVKSVTGMDLQRSAIRSAIRNAKLNDIVNCAFAQNASLNGAKQLAANGEKFDLVLLDPPRQGCAEVIPVLPGLEAAQVIYISCDPATLCRDLLLLEGAGYEVERMKMVDMFPQTHHLETIVSLIRLADPS